MTRSTSIRSLALVPALLLGLCAGQAGAAAVSISIVDGVAREGTSDVAILAVQVPTAVTQPLYVSYRVGGTAALTGDYTGTESGYVTILPGQTMGIICIQALADTVTEGNETVIIQLSTTSDPAYTIPVPSPAATIVIYPPATSTTGSGGWDIKTGKTI